MRLSMWISRGLLTLAALTVLCLPITSHAGIVPELRLCTGQADGNYYLAGRDIATQAKNAVSVVVQDSLGSVDCLGRLSRGEADAAIVQSNSFLVSPFKLDLERSAVLYREYVHLLCNRAVELSKITKLTAKTTVAIGPNGTGSRTTWESFVKADPDTYGKVPTLPLNGERALAKIADGEDAVCLLYHAGLRTAFMNEKAISYASKLVLVPTDDSDMKKQVDARGRQIFGYAEIPSGTYAGLQDGLFSSAVSAIYTDALVVSSAAWIDKNPSGYDAFLSAIRLAAPGITKRMSGT